MIGSSLQNKLMGLKEPEDAYMFDTLQVGANASSITDGISFADTDSNASSLTPVTKSFNDYHKMYVFARLEAKRIGTGILNESWIGENAPCWMRMMPIGINEIFCISRGGAITEVNSNTIFNQTANVSSYIGADKIDTYFNGQLWTTETVNTVTASVVYNNLLACIERNAHYFNADVETFAIGFIESDKVALVDEAFRLYCDQNV